MPGDNPFAKPQVREAMAHALDRDAIKTGRDARPVGALGHERAALRERLDAEMDAYSPPDIDRAKALMAEAGYPDGFSVDLHCPNDRYLNDEAICQAFVGMLGRIGINANLVSQSRTIHFPADPERRGRLLPARLGRADLRQPVCLRLPRPFARGGPRRLERVALQQRGGGRDDQDARDRGPISTSATRPSRRSGRRCRRTASSSWCTTSFWPMPRARGSTWPCIPRTSPP
jgi:hypothetical protein